MSFYILATDHISLFERGHTQLISRLTQPTRFPLALTIITVEELLRGRFASIRAAKNETQLINAYRLLNQTIETVSQFQIVPYDEPASQFYTSLRALRFRVGTQDLRIAAITLAVSGILLTRNHRDFEQIPNLSPQDWTI